MSLSHVLVRRGVGVENLDVAGKVAVAIMLAELVEVLIGDVAEVQLVVANGKHVVIDVLCIRLAPQYWLNHDSHQRRNSIVAASDIVCNLQAAKTTCWLS